MKIELEFPFNQDWNKGYIVINPDKRRTVILYNSNQQRSSVSYARYLMCVHLKRYLTEKEHVDHIDDDKTNDHLSNLQILTPLQNAQKTAKGETQYNFICPICKKEFKLTARQSHRKNPPCCSKQCGGKMGHNTKQK